MAACRPSERAPPRSVVVVVVISAVSEEARLFRRMILSGATTGRVTWYC